MKKIYGRYVSGGNDSSVYKHLFLDIRGTKIIGIVGYSNHPHHPQIEINGEIEITPNLTKEELETFLWRFLFTKYNYAWNFVEGCEKALSKEGIHITRAGTQIAPDFSL